MTVNFINNKSGSAVVASFSEVWSLKACEKTVFFFECRQFNLIQEIFVDYTCVLFTVMGVVGFEKKGEFKAL